jgi:hypothetical protein
MNIDTTKITSVVIFFIEAGIFVVIAVVLIQASRKKLLSREISGEMRFKHRFGLISSYILLIGVILVFVVLVVATITIH